MGSLIGLRAFDERTYDLISADDRSPVYPVTTIQYSLPNSSFTTMEVYTVLGEKVTTLVKGEMAAGIHEVQFNAANLPSGIYFYRLSAAGELHIEKILLSK
jgi:hypothetical protein